MVQSCALLTPARAPLTCPLPTFGARAPQDFILRQRGVRTVALCGFLTNCCVESTMRAAYERGYEVVTLKDCCAATRRVEGQGPVGGVDSSGNSSAWGTPAMWTTLRQGIVRGACAQRQGLQVVWRFSVGSPALRLRGSGPAV